MNDIVILKDINGIKRQIPLNEIMTNFTENKLTIYGIDMKSMMQMRTEYLKCGGNLPITAQSVKKAFTAAYQSAAHIAASALSAGPSFGSGPARPS